MTLSWSCVSGCNHSGTQELMFFSSIRHTRLITGAGDTPILTHRCTKRVAISARLLTGSLRTSWELNCLCTQYFIRCHTAGTEAPTERWQTCCSDSGCLLHRRTSGYCWLQPLYVQLFRTPAGNNLHLGDKGESLAV